MFIQFSKDKNTNLKMNYETKETTFQNKAYFLYKYISICNTD